jgi:uncharacterized protein
MNIRVAALVGLIALAACAPTGTKVASPNLSAGRDAQARGDVDLALGNLVPLAQQGDPEAQWRLGSLYVNGPASRFSQSRGEGVELIRKAAAQGYAQAQLELGTLYEYGKAGLPQDDAEAAKWLLRAAEQDNANAEIEIGYFYEKGRGVAVNPSEAVRWTARSAEQGNASALRNIGYFYAQGIGVSKDTKGAIYWYNVAARFAPTDAFRASMNGWRDQQAGQIPVAEAQQAMAESLAWTPGKGGMDRVRRDAKIAETGDGAGSLTVSGSGVIFTRSGNILTAAHVVHECQKVTVALPGGAALPAEVLAQDGTNDLAVIKSTLTSASPVQLRATPPRLGEAVAVAGFPLGHILDNDLNLTTGTVSALSGIQDDSSMLQVTAAVQPGNSGGPLYDGNGNLLGIVSRKLNAIGMVVATGALPENLAYAVKSSVIRLFLDTKGLAYETTAGKPMGTPDLANAARAVTVKIECVRQ